MIIMHLFKNIKYIIWALAISLPILLISSCIDEDITPSYQEKYNPADDPNMVCLPLSIAFGGTNSTRAEGDQEKDPGFTDGSAKEHQIDFDTHTNELHESFAIIFQNKKVKYIQPLYLSEQLGSGSKPEGEENVEYEIPVVTYIDKEDVEKIDGENGLYKPLVTEILVVLNGGKVYKKIADEVNKLQNNHTSDDIIEILKLKWENPAKYENEDRSKWNTAGEEGIIGFNDAGLFTMTNSIYYDKENNKEGDEQNDNDFKLISATPISGPAYESVRKYVETPNAEPSATVYVERIVAKFSAPTFDTEVIGSNRVFRPDQNALPLIVYSWDGDNPVPVEKNWRIHLLGWAINGDESETYLFKKIPDPNDLNNWNFTSWNDATNHRSYWSIDPHYSPINENGTYDFYPWQFRKAADKEDIISIQAGLNIGLIGDETDRKEDTRTPVLRYNSFNDVLNSWAWRNELHVHENTFDPNNTEWYDRGNTKSFLDDRASMLAGPHLLIAGELYLEQPGGSYLGQFGTVENLYGDRIRRYYMTEADFFKMFVRDFNRALVAQEQMSFEVYDWDAQSSNKAHNRYQAYPSGQCRLFLRQLADRYKEFDPNARTIDGVEHEYDEPDEEGNKFDYRDVGYKFTEVTMDLIDALVKEGYSLSALANVRNGDGRLIPWIEGNEGVDIRKKWENFGLVVRAPDGSRLKYKETTDTEDPKNIFKNTDWSYDMYKSLFYEWFGPIDHYNKGYMYYAGDIRHKNVTDVNSHKYYGTVRNHWYKFRVESINSLGIPVDDPDQLIIPGQYNYRDQIIVYLDVLGWHSTNTIVDIP